MANPEHFAILKQGVKAWNKWREKNPEIIPDLHGSDLVDAELNEVDLSHAILSDTTVRQALLSEANLIGASLVRADMSGADLLGSHLIDANLTRANLTGALLYNANVRGAILAEATFCGANLVEADFRSTNLEAADLSDSELTDTNFRDANLTNAKLNNALVGMTMFADVDLSTVMGLDTVRHGGPSSIGVDSIYKSKGRIPEVFLRGCGVPEDMIAYARSLRGKTFEFYSCFISHSVKDKLFCERLNADLQAKGVRVWYFPEDAKWGETVWGEIDRSIKIYDKLVVVCSENSLASGPMQREIERALNREDKEHKNILFPIRIDDYIFVKWDHSRKADVLAKVVGDFSRWEHDAAKYDRAFERLLKGLQAESGRA